MSSQVSSIAFKVEKAVNERSSRSTNLSAGVGKKAIRGTTVSTVKDEEVGGSNDVEDDVFGSVETGKHVSVMAYVRSLNIEHEKRRASCGGGPGSGSDGLRGISSRSSSSGSNGGSNDSCCNGGEGRKGSLENGRIGLKASFFSGSGNKLSNGNMFVEKFKRNDAASDVKSSERLKSDTETRNNVQKDSLKGLHPLSPRPDGLGGIMFESVNKEFVTPVGNGLKLSSAELVEGKPKAGANVIVNTVHFVTSEGRPASVDENKTFGVTMTSSRPTPKPSSRPIPNPRVRATEGSNLRGPRESPKFDVTDESVSGSHCRVLIPTEDDHRMVNVQGVTNRTASRPSRVPLPVTRGLFKIEPFESPSNVNEAGNPRQLLLPAVSTSVVMSQLRMASPSVAAGESDADNNDNSIMAPIEGGADDDTVADIVQMREETSAVVGAGDDEKVQVISDKTKEETVRVRDGDEKVGVTSDAATTSVVSSVCSDGSVRNIGFASIDDTLSAEFGVDATALTREVVVPFTLTANSSQREEEDPFKPLVIADNTQYPAVAACVSGTAADAATPAVMETSSPLKGLEMIANDSACGIGEAFTNKCSAGVAPSSVNDIGSDSNGIILVFEPQKTSNASALISTDVCDAAVAPIAFLGGPVTATTTKADCWANTVIVSSHTIETAAAAAAVNTAECNSSPCTTRPLSEPQSHVAGICYDGPLSESRFVHVPCDIPLPEAQSHVVDVLHGTTLPEVQSHVAQQERHASGAGDVALANNGMVATEGLNGTVASAYDNAAVVITRAGTNDLDLCHGKHGCIEMPRAVALRVETTRAATNRVADSPQDKLASGAPEKSCRDLDVSDSVGESSWFGKDRKAFGDCDRIDMNYGTKVDRVNLEDVRTCAQASLKIHDPAKKIISSAVLNEKFDEQTNTSDREINLRNSICVSLDTNPCSDLFCKSSCSETVSSFADCLQEPREKSVYLHNKPLGSRHDAREAQHDPHGTHHEPRGAHDDPRGENHGPPGLSSNQEIHELLRNSNCDGVVDHAPRSGDESTPRDEFTLRNHSDDANRRSETLIYNYDKTRSQKKRVDCEEDVIGESLVVSEDLELVRSGSSISEGSLEGGNARMNRKERSSTQGDTAMDGDGKSLVRSKCFEGVSSLERKSGSGSKSFESEGSPKRGSGSEPESFEGGGSPKHESGSGKGDVLLQEENISFGESDREGSPYLKDNPNGRGYAEQLYGEFVSQLKGRRNNPLMASSTSIASSTWYIDLAMSSSVGGGDDSDGSLASSRAPSVASIVPDKYGFIGGAQYTADGKENIPVHVIRKRESKWLEMLNHWDAFMMKKYDKVRDRCRKGIPSAIRARAWLHLCGAVRVLENNPGVFDRLAAAPLDPRTEDEIRKDLHRQFPRHEMFLRRGGQGQEDLFQVLKVHSLVCGDGYCQAHAPLAAVLLMQMPAEQAFWCLRAICDKYVPGYYSHGLEAIQVDGVILFKLLKKVSPSVYKLLKKQKIDPVLYMTEWFMCLFSRSLPWASVLRVWDMFFCEGVKVLFRVGLVMLKFGLRPEVRAQCPSMYESLQALRNMAPGIVAEDFLLMQLQRLDISEDDLQKEHMRQITKRDQDKLQAEKEKEQKQKARER